MKLEVELVKHSLVYISEEMGVALRKSAYSPNIRERADHSCAILDASGKLIGQAEHIPVHIGSLPLGLRNTLKYLAEKDVEVSEGDMYVLNDPYIAGTHLNDVTTIRPVFYGGKLVAYVANKAHQVDVGGIDPSSITIRAETIWHEGLVIPPVKLMEKNKLVSDVLEIIKSNTRMPEVTLGDLRAQVAANILGEKKLIELIEKVSYPVFVEAVENVLDRTHRTVKSELAEMPHGTCRASDFLELDERDIEIKASVEISSEGFRVSFDGTDKQVDRPLNAVLGVTTAATTYTLRTLLSRDILLNDGFLRTISIDAPLGTVVNPVKPAPVAAGNLETSQRIVDTLYKALSQLMPERIPAASNGSMNNLMMGGVHPETGRTWAFYETIGGGGGARPGMDGVDGIHCHMTNTLNTPIEVIEHYYPVLFMSYRLRDGSGGEGRWRGGMGIERSFKALAKIHAAVMGERSRHRPWGLQGGGEGAPSEYIVKRANGETVKLKSKDTTILDPGDVLIIRTAGGGGYGSV
ncbi:MAG: hydantoinase B/oxoprolinase family protein [Candidatus Caldarchaeum sp.]|nr:hydantoinase B/oxoprolinase family protein [Candidatus Caldarchaeum sp.]MDW8063740.1 hydantoinase B/oxoprolinase family protein [Candidatus Caldarchaeum sp.]MDW8435056.1 hydantoinase B/oxoprolinase family protein [Candidatus Caldarchaeum sp.]